MMHVEHGALLAHLRMFDGEPITEEQRAAAREKFLAEPAPFNASPPFHYLDAELRERVLALFNQ